MTENAKNTDKPCSAMWKKKMSAILYEQSLRHINEFQYKINDEIVQN